MKQPMKNKLNLKNGWRHLLYADVTSLLATYWKLIVENDEENEDHGSVPLLEKIILE